MKNPIIIAKMICSGEPSVEGRLENPFVKVEIDPNDTAYEVKNNNLIYHFKYLFDDLVFRVPIDYREATMDLDHPFFKVTVSDSEDNVISVIEEDYHTEEIRDTFYKYDHSSDVLDYVIPIENIKSGEEITLKFNFETKLEQYEWKKASSVIYGLGDHIETLSEQKDIIVKFTVDQIVLVSFDANYTSGGWNENYHIKAQVNNQMDAFIEYEILCTEEDDKGIQSAKVLERVVEGPQISGSGQLPQGTHKFLSDDIRKSWIWYDELPFWFARKGPYSRVFKYHVEFKLINIIRNGEVEPVNYTYPILTLTNTISVSEYKINCAESATVLWGTFITYTAIATGLAIAGAFSCVPCIVMAVEYTVCATIAMGIATWLGIKAKDPIEFDNDFNKVHDYKAIVEEFQVKGMMPLQVKQFGETYGKINALLTSLNTTYNRFMSSLKKNNKKALNMQREHANKLNNELVENLIELNKSLNKIKKSEKKSKILYKEDAINSTIKELNEKGLPKQYKDELINRGYNNTTVKKIEKIAKKLKPEDLKRSISNDFEKLYYSILDQSLQPLNLIQKIDKIKSLSTFDAELELMRAGLTSPKEYYKRVEKSKEVTNYIINEIEGIGNYYTMRLSESGILTTNDLLNRCSSDLKLAEFSKEIGISRKSIQKWVNMAELMSLKGIGEEYSEILLKLGIKDLDGLAKSELEKLYNKMTEQKELQKLVKKMPTKRQLKEWIGNAKSRI